MIILKDTCTKETFQFQTEQEAEDFIESYEEPSRIIRLFFNKLPAGEESLEDQVKRGVEDGAM